MRLRWARSPLLPLEVAVVEAVAAALPDDAALKLRRQMGAVRRAVRLPPDWGSVDLYVSGWVNRDRSLPFGNDAEEIKLATLRLACEGFAGTWTARVYLVHGWLFNLGFRPSPKSIMRCTNVVIQKVTIHVDPMRAPGSVPKPPSPIRPVQLRGWVAGIAAAHGVSDVRPPLPDAARRHHLERIDCRLPDDYLELTRQCDGFEIGECSVLGLADTYDLDLPEGHVCVLATTAGGILCHVCEEDSAAVLAIHHDAPGARRFGSFRAALEDALQTRG